ncbi:uncharacterized protein LOC111571818 [Amphiprion ocellaris]|uniref:uncharacterized protein LOC111571818 n=2 Tax=Amphiprion ocellaris TaxID=80972 RepID=UPI001649B9B3|nr:uncharacterized protein LOC111571818 [Amphiprion ocellaris]
MDTLDEITTATLKDANIGEDILPSLSRDDIKDLFPGPQNFLRRRALWLVVNKQEEETHAEKVPPSTTRASDLSQEEPNTSKFVTISNPEYIVFTDSELEQARRYYFEQKRLGTDHVEPLSKDLFCRLIRNTMTNMISIARATEDFRYPSKHEVNAMAKRLVEYYPMITGRCGEWEHVAKKLMKRLSNVKSPRKAKGPPSKKPRQDGDADAATTDYDGDSSGSTIILSPARASTPVEQQGSSDEASPSTDFYSSQKTQARHYKTLQQLYKTKKPNKAAVTQLMDLEFQSRRLFIDSDAVKEQDRPTKILEAYPCFREVDHVLDELRRIIQPSNSRYISEMKERWENFYSKVQFYGVMKKLVKPPNTLNGVEHATAVFRALPQLFPSSTVPPKKLGASSEALFHVLTTSEDPDCFLRQRPLSCPFVLVSEDNCMIAVGSTPVTTFDREDLYEGLLYVMAYYYALHLTYPKCISTLLSVLQTEILQDSIHDRDSTPSYKKALAEWKSFIE